MNRKILLKLAAGLTALLLLAVLLLLANSFVGNPLAARAARNRGREYLEERYGRPDLEIKGVTYNPKDSSYIIAVFSSTSRDTHFFLRYREGEIYADDYEIAVLSGWNTMERFCDEYTERLTALVQAEMSAVVNISVLPEKRVRYELALDAPFDQKLVEDVEISLRSTGGNDAGHLAEVLKRVSSLMTEKGYAAARFRITGEDGRALTQLMNISAAQVESDNLEEILQRAVADTEYDGIISFGKGSR